MLLTNTNLAMLDQSSINMMLNNVAYMVSAYLIPSHSCHKRA